MDDRAELIRHLKKVGIDGSTPKWDERSDGFEWKRRRRRALAGISDRFRLYELQS